MLYFCDVNPTIAAECLDDARIQSSIPYALDILSEASHSIGLPRFRDAVLPTDEVRWTAGTRGNWVWVYHYLISLFDESAYREKRQHLLKPMLRPIGLLRQYFPTDCKRESQKVPNFTLISHRSNVIAYRLYLINHWRVEKPKPIWSYRGLPLW